MNSPISHWESSRSISRVFRGIVSGAEFVVDLVSGREVVTGDGLVVGGGSGGGWIGAGRRAHMSLLSLLRFASIHTRHGCR